MNDAWRERVKVFASTLIGNTMLAFAICAFVTPKDFMLGGSGGIALFIQYWLPGVRLSIITAVVNVALFALGWVFMGWKFTAGSLLSTIIYPFAIAVFEELPVAELFAGEDTLLCAIFCAVLIGGGIGMVIRVGASTGGMDIPPCILQKYKGIPIGTSLMFFDGSIVLAQVLLKGLDGVLYSILILALTSVVVDKATVSGEQKVEMTIISPKYEEIREALLEKQDAGVTMLNIETGYLEDVQKAILTVVYAKKYPAARDTVLKIDPRAFIITADVKNVNGVGYTLSRPPQVLRNKKTEA